MARRGPTAAGQAKPAGSRLGLTAPVAPADPAENDPEPDPDSVARTICLRLLTVRARSRTELAEALHKRNVPGDAAERVLDRLTEVGLVNDESFAIDFVQAKRAERGLATRELSRQLRVKGVSTEAIDAALADVGEEAEHASARQLAERKLRGMSGLESRVQIRRLAGMLARKGYSPGLTFQVVREVVGEAATESMDSDTMLA
jgi:regulatory protein